MKTANAYPELTEFENMIILMVGSALAQRYGLNREDYEDVRQELALWLFEKRQMYDPDENQEPYDEYILKSVKWQAKDIIRKIRPDFRIDNEMAESAIDAIADDNREKITESEAVVRTMSEIVYNQLSPAQQRLVNQLTAGFTINEIARQSRVPYKTMHSRVERIRRVFRKHGMRAPRAEAR